MNWIQKEIFRKLVLSDELRYTELKPESVEGNLFTYHLNQLVYDGYVTKIDKKYTLSETGKSYVSSMSLATGAKRKQPKIVVMIAGKNENGEFLLFKWKRQPYRELVSFPFGKVQYGKPVLDLTKKELDWKTGLKGDLRYQGDIYVQTTNEHYLAHIFKLSALSGKIGSNGILGKPFWGKVEELNENELIPGFKAIVEILETKKPPYLEEVIT